MADLKVDSKLLIVKVRHLEWRQSQFTTQLLIDDRLFVICFLCDCYMREKGVPTFTRAAPIKSCWFGRLKVNYVAKVVLRMDGLVSRLINPTPNTPHSTEGSIMCMSSNPFGWRSCLPAYRLR